MAIIMRVWGFVGFWLFRNTEICEEISRQNRATRAEENCKKIAYYWAKKRWYFTCPPYVAWVYAAPDYYAVR